MNSLFPIEDYFSDSLINVSTYYFQNALSNVLSPSPPHLPLSSQLLVEFIASLALALQCVVWFLLREHATLCWFLLAHTCPSLDFLLLEGSHMFLSMNFPSAKPILRHVVNVLQIFVGWINMWMNDIPGKEKRVRDRKKTLGGFQGSWEWNSVPVYMRLNPVSATCKFFNQEPFTYAKPWFPSCNLERPRPQLLLAGLSKMEVRTWHTSFSFSFCTVQHSASFSVDDNQ